MRYRSGPRALWLVRHGQSEGNVARDAADRDGLERVELPVRDADVPLSDLGRRQAEAFGHWLGEQPRERQPTTVLCSPYLRARQTARRILTSAGGDLARLEVDVDERLRDREMGVLTDLTWNGITALHAEEADRARRLGRYYHRPPGGESWADMTLRLRSVLADVALHLADERVLVVGHDVPIQLVRAIVEGLDEKELVALATGTAYANCGLTAFERTTFDDGSQGYDRVAYNWTAPVESEGEPATEEPDERAPGGELGTATG